jgi:hypothetical protein
VEAAFVEPFIVKSEKENMETKYEIPKLEIASIIDDRVTQTKRKRNRSKIPNIFNREKL